ncbi:cytochrome c1-like [Sebastes umbrosus]|uniref:cytochrome c1-like n=1 Tax=Sebastes umbrosus TaxID=72105 RepID=UPI00189EFE8B|nr:cytochrome c1-like [Sebastes umbrosus]
MASILGEASVWGIVSEKEGDTDMTETTDEPVLPESGAVGDDEVPGKEVPSEEVPGEEVPCEEVPGEEVPCEEVPSEEVPDEEVPGEEVPCEEVPGEEVPGEGAAAAERPTVPSTSASSAHGTPGSGRVLTDAVLQT